MKKILAFTLTLVMLFTMVVSIGMTNVSALNGVGIPGSSFNGEYLLGCDISRYNVLDTLDYSRVDFAKMKADGCDFVILRIGYEYSKDHKDYIDEAFLGYYERARAADMPLGVYFYSRARTYAEAKQDAEWVINVIESNNMYFEYPIYYDVEAVEQMGGTINGVTYTALSNSALENMTLGFMETMEAAGYFPAFYSMWSTVRDKISSDYKKKWDIWGAQVKNDEGLELNELGPEYKYDDIAHYNNMAMWQFGWYGHELFNGYTWDSKYHQLDVNVCYKDYPAIMEQYGYNNCVAAEPSLVSGKTPLTSSGAALAPVNTNYNASLTDGKAAAISSIDTAGSWFGFKEGVNTVGNNAEIIFDLGARYDITGASIHLGNLVDYAICSPTNLRISVSDTLGSGYVPYGTNFTVKNSAESANAKVDYWSELTNMTGLTGRYVKISCTLGGPWFMLNEIKIFGKLNTAPIPVSNSIVNKKPYTISGNGTTMGSYTANLTDGVASDNVNVHADWFAFKNVADANTVNGEGAITFDLGSAYNITGAKVHLGYNDGWGVTNPWGVYISVSNDGVNYSDAKEFPIVKANTGDAYACWTELSGLTGFAGRYVKIMVGVNGTWAFLNEIEVYGNAHTCVAGSWETTKEPTASEAGTKQQCCTGCGKVMATESIPATGIVAGAGDINQDGKLTAVDYMMVKKYVFGSLDVSTAGDLESLLARADVTGDGKVTAVDYFKLKILILS